MKEKSKFKYLKLIFLKKFLYLMASSAFIRRLWDKMTFSKLNHR